MGRGHEEVLDEVLFLRRRADAALAAAPLRAVERQGRALDVAAAGHGDDHVLLDDQVLDVDVRGLGHDLRAPLVAELLLDRPELLHDDLEDELLGAEDLAELRDQGQDLLELGDDLLALEAGQPVEAHVEDRLRLDVVEPQDLGALALAALVRRARSR